LTLCLLLHYIPPVSPVKPQELRELVPADDDNICEIFVKVAKFCLLFYRLHKYMWASDGTLATGWTTDLCERMRYYQSVPTTTS